MPLFRRRNRQKEALRDARVAESQSLLINAAVETTQVAQEVTRTMQRRMEDAIKQFIAAARIMNDALLICDPLGTITAFNPAAQRMFLLPEEPLEGCTTLFSQRDGTMLDVEELWATSRHRTALSGIRSDGSRFPTYVRTAVLERSDGTSLVLLVAQDMSLIENAFGSSIHGYAIISGNQIVAVNGSMTRIYGYDQDELLGKPARFVTECLDRAGLRLNLTFEIANIQWEGESAILITTREVKG